METRSTRKRNEEAVKENIGANRKLSRMETRSMSRLGKEGGGIEINEENKIPAHVLYVNNDAPPPSSLLGLLGCDCALSIIFTLLGPGP